ncbi:conserved exported hypothetical protein [Candidatus Terasakiella magnetica]|nr:conserved exported hypothetical protein [Candidatus Terasakiella magnetica]
MTLSRRTLLINTLAAAALPRAAFAAIPGDRRLVIMVLRGGMDGLHAVPPLGDPDYALARGALALQKGGDKAAFDLDGFFGLHPALGPLLPLWTRHELAIVHAAASPYRERSHFDAQDVLESGGAKPHALNDGWLNRAATSLRLGHGAALALSQNLPLILRGAASAASWAPSPLSGLPPEMVKALTQLYSSDPALALALEEGVQMEAFVSGAMADDMDMKPGQAKKKSNAFPDLAAAAGKVMAAADGPLLEQFAITLVHNRQP